MKWRQQAFERLPEFRGLLQEEKSPYSFIGDLVFKLEQAYETGDEDLIKRIYQFVFWCMHAPRGKDASDDLVSIVVVSFLEDLPKHEVIRQDVGRWFPRGYVLGMKEIFTYLGTEAEYQEMVESCKKQEI